MRRGIRVVVAPDSFKGSLSALAAARAMAAGARRALGPGATVTAVPMADGGEGTLDALLGAWQGREVRCEVTDALGRTRTARYGLSADGTTAVIEAAEANGLPYVRDVPLQPLRADSAGVGELARAALESGAREILLCIGGSATTDGGAGVLRALGARLLDRNGAPVAPGGGGLAAIDRIELEDLHPLARRASWRVAVDVDNPLVGERGAAAVFGPQKGATPSDVVALDAGLAHLARTLADATGADEAALLSTPGMGAAGGLPASLCAALGAEIVPGARLVADAVGLQALLAGADVVLTGEGSFDAQSLHGKVVDGVRDCAPAGAAIVVVAGRVEVSAAEVAAAGLTAAVSIARGPATEDQLRDDAAELVADAAESVCRMLAR
ncbi:glycerate kinase [Georgenia satyanarayanai]|uniref:glycerate kinase n=1 Tax=Georgenia satyanarayanai TaxID=860221 RepID=UPI0012646A51|nr:glycerate kinase [Georgenia satyanarayanai]